MNKLVITDSKDIILVDANAFLDNVQTQFMHCIILGAWAKELNQNTNPRLAQPLPTRHFSEPLQYRVSEG